MRRHALERSRGAQARTCPQNYNAHVYYALTLIGPREAKTGDPRENDLTAALATNAETSVLVINDLFFFAAADNIPNP